MKQFILSISLACLAHLAPAQSLPRGFEAGNIVLADNSLLQGFVKSDMRKNAAIQFIPAAGSKKITYRGDQLNGVSVGTDTYICRKGDFFKQVCPGTLSLLQKASDARAIPVYVGNEALFINGTEGKPGDYFTLQQETLTLVKPGQLQQLVITDFPNCGAVISQAK